MEITEKVAYLKGLMEGMEMDKSTKEGKVFASIVDILDDIALSISDLESGVTMVAHQVDMLDEDLSELQDDFYEEEDECGCGHHHHDEFDGELYEVTCPSCGDTVCVDEDMLDEGEIECPGCGETLEFDLDGVLDERDLAVEDND